MTIDDVLAEWKKKLAIYPRTTVEEDEVLVAHFRTAIAAIEVVWYDANSATLTNDDGYRNQGRNTLDILQRHLCPRPQPAEPPSVETQLAELRERVERLEKHQ
jgi:hypothetical protein